MSGLANHHHRQVLEFSEGNERRTCDAEFSITSPETKRETWGRPALIGEGAPGTVGQELLDNSAVFHANATASMEALPGNLIGVCRLTHETEPEQGVDGPDPVDGT